MKIYILIGLGGFFGSMARYALSHFALIHISGRFPLGTFLCNAIGCLLIGLFYALAERAEILSYEWRLFLTVGFCGGFTTFSTFANESLLLLRNGQWYMVALYAALSVFIGVAMVALGYFIIKMRNL